MSDAITYSIANHLLRIEGDTECRLLREKVYGFPVFEVEEQDPEWRIVFGKDIERPQNWEEMYRFDFEATTMWCSFAKVGETYYFYIDPNGNPVKPLLMRYEMGSDVVEATHGEDPVMLRFALWMALGMVSCRSKMVLIHSSTVVHQGKAILCLGESGTGKSTHTRLWLSHIPDSHLLNDDSPILAFENGEAVVYGSPWSGKTHCYHQLRFPLAAALRLSQAPYNKIHRLGILEAFSSLQPSFPPALAQDEKYMDMMCDLLSDVIGVTPIYHLECLPDEAAAWTSHDAIFGKTK